jgi:hypothetical protein
MTIQPFTILELATAGTALAGAVALILRQVQNSKCKTCNCCWCIKCEREVPHENDNIEIVNPENSENTNNSQN